MILVQYKQCALTSVNSLMLMLLACFATFLFTSSRAVMLGCAAAGGGLLVMEGSDSSEDKVPMFDKAAVMVAVRDRDTEAVRQDHQIIGLTYVLNKTFKYDRIQLNNSTNYSL